jgi:hypothetical protein
VQLQEAEDPEAIKSLKDLYGELFDESCPYSIGKEVAMVFKDKLKKLVDELDSFAHQKNNYPFLNALDVTLGKLKILIDGDYSKPLTQVNELRLELVEAKELVIDPIRRFMNGEQRKIYDDIRNALNGDRSNFEYVEGEELGILNALIENPKPYQGKLIREAKAAKDALTNKVLAKIEEERILTQETIQECILRLEGEPDFSKLPLEDQVSILKPLKSELDKLQNQGYIGNLRNIGNTIKNVLFINQLNEVYKKSQEMVAIGGETTVNKVVYAGSIEISFPRNQLKTEEDVDAYVEAMRAEFKKQIQNNRRISL